MSIPFCGWMQPCLNAWCASGTTDRFRSLE
jgi:hypothetical protein